MIQSAKHRPPAASAPTNGSPPTNGGAAFASAARGRSSWSGLLRVSLVAVPVKAYAAVSSASTSSHCHMLHADCGQRIGYQKHCPRHGAVDSAAIVRGYEYARGQHVVVEPEELEKLRPDRDKALVLEQFIALAEVDPTFFAGRSLYLLPDGPAAQHPYGVLVDALRHAGKGALGRVVLSGSRQLVLVRPAGRVLALDVLHFPAQVRLAASWEADVVMSAATPEERALAAQLIALASGPADWARYRDTSAEELAALLQAKVADQPPPAAAEEPAAILQLLDALQQSVAAADNGTPAPAKGRKPRARRASA